MDNRKLRSKKNKSRNVRPYDRPNQSILGRVASKVKGLLNPSWIINVSQWMGSSNQQTSAAPVSEDDSGSEEESAPQLLGHGSKRPRLRLNDNSLSAGTQTWLDIPPSNSQSSVPQTSLSSLPTNFVFNAAASASASVPQGSLMENKESSILMNGGDDHSENSEGSASTSGCSSLVSHKDRSSCGASNMRLSEMALKNLGGEMKNVMSLKRRRIADVQNDQLSASVSGSRISLWSSGVSPAARSPVSRSNQPSFNVSAFIAPSKLSQQQKAVSPFYQGRTTFGGASSTRRLPVSTAPYQVDKSMRSQMKVKAAQSQDTLEGMSSAAKRILQTLEKMSSPVTDAKKIPNTDKSPVDVSLYLKPPRHRIKLHATPTMPTKGPPIANISTISKLTKVKSFPNTYMDSPPIVREDSSVIISDSPKDSSHGGGKIKNRLNQQYQSSKAAVSELPEPLSLPNVPLPISTMPTFSFSSKLLTGDKINHVSKPALHKQSIFSESSTISQISPSVTIDDDISIVGHVQKVPQASISENTTTFNQFISSKPSTPKEKDIDSSEDALVPSVRSEDFVFSNPIVFGIPCASLTPKLPETTAISNVPQPITAAPTFTISSKLVTGEKVNHVASKPATPKQTDYHKLSKPEDSASIGETFSKNTDDKLKVPESSNDRISTRDVFNKFSSSKSSVPKEKTFESIEDTLTPSVTPEDFVFSNPIVYGMPASNLPSKVHWKPNVEGVGLIAPNQWECDICLVRNANTATKCVACETSKPDKNAPVRRLPEPEKSNPPAEVTLTASSEAPTTTSSSTTTFKFGQATTGATTSNIFSTVSSHSTITEDSNKSKISFAATKGSDATKLAPLENTLSKSQTPASTPADPALFQFGHKNGSTAGSDIFPSVHAKSSDAVSTVAETKLFSTATKVSEATKLAPPENTVSKSPIPVSTPAVSTMFKFGQASTAGSNLFSSVPAKSLEVSTVAATKESDAAKLAPLEDTLSKSQTPVSTSAVSTMFKFGQTSVTSTAGSDFFPSVPAKFSNAVSTVADTKQFSTAVPAITVSNTENPIKPASSSIFQFGSNAISSTTSTPTFGSVSSGFTFATKTETATSTTTTFGQSVFGNVAPSSFGNAEKPSSDFKINAVSSSQPTQPAFQFGSRQSVGLMTPNMWECASCSVRNSNDSMKCVACETPKPNQGLPSQNNSDSKKRDSQNNSRSSKFRMTTSAVSTPATATTTFKFGQTSAAPISTAFFGSVQNSSLNAAPVSKETKPAGSGFLGFKAVPFESKPANVGGFSSLASDTSTSPKTKPAGFGGFISAPTSTSAAAPVFKFGSAASTTPSSGFTFGAQSTSAAPATNFAFGSGSPAPTNASVFSGFAQNPSSTPAFQFGSQSSNATASAPAFGSGLAAAPAAQGGFRFAGKSDGPAQMPAATPQVPAFFGNTTQTSAFGKVDKPSGGFNFAASASITPVFQFGSQEKKQATAAQFGFGAAEQNSSFNSGGFNMNTPSNFNFSAMPAASPAPFQFAANAGNTDNTASAPRKIRRAVRRTMRKD